MRTTINIDDDILPILKALSAQRKESLGKVVTSLIRRGLQPKHPQAVRNGVPILKPAASDTKPDLHLVNKI